MEGPSAQVLSSTEQGWQALPLPKWTRGRPAHMGWSGQGRVGTPEGRPGPLGLWSWTPVVGVLAGMVHSARWGGGVLGKQVVLTEGGRGGPGTEGRSRGKTGQGNRV